MMKSPETTEALARAYREARVLVLGDRSPKTDRAVTLHRDFLAVRAKFQQDPLDEQTSWDAQLFEKARRATIVALRHQALLLAEQAEAAPLEGTQITRRANITLALQLAGDGLDLHVSTDPDRDRTIALEESLRRKLAGVQS